MKCVLGSKMNHGTWRSKANNNVGIIELTGRAGECREAVDRGFGIWKLHCVVLL